MKFVVLISIVLFAVAVNSFPASNDKIDDGDVELFRPSYSSRHDGKFSPGVIDVNASSDEDDDDDRFYLGQSFHSLLNNLRRQMQEAAVQYRKNFDDLLKKGNTTSTVEIIDGHKVIKNETVYEDPNKFIKSVVIHVVPNGDGSVEHTSTDEISTRTKPSRPSETYTVEPDTEPIHRKKDREPLGESVENEVDGRSSEVENFNIETLDDNEIPSPSLDKFQYEIDDGSYSFEKLASTRPEAIPEIPYDLSNDIIVNDAPGLPINPDAEYFDITDLMPPKLA